MNVKSVFGPNFAQWKALETDDTSLGEASPEEISRIEHANNELKSALLSSMQMQHVVALAGSGTSLGSVGGPSMWTLWDHCVNSNAGSTEKRKPSELATDVISEVGYRTDVDDENIEALLSRCDAYLQIKDSKDVSEFVRSAKTIILDMCSSFLLDAEEAKLASHRLFLHRLSRRRARDSRMKLFTTNYDLCFEIAAGKQGLVVIDGFSFSFPRRFDPRFFSYDIVRRPAIGDESSNPLEGVFHLYKLHGSTNWARQEDGEIIMELTTADTACLIYPARGKYQQSYVQPHLELVSQYLSALREPNTCLVVAGFGFNDDHLSEPILSAARTNPHMRIIVVDSFAQERTTSAAGNRYWREIRSLSQQGNDIWLINATFEQFAELIPDLKSLTPGDRLLRDIKIATGA